MDRFEARVAVREALRGAGPDRRREAAVPAQRRALLARPVRADRAAAVAAVVRQGRAAGEGGGRRRARRRVVVHPKELEPRWFAWVDNMHDWCISRQLWWGHRIPVWYGPDGEVVCLGPDEEPPAGCDARTRTSSTPGSPRGCGRSPRSAGRTTPPDLQPLLPDVRAGHGLRHPVLLGRPDDDVRPVRDGRRAAVPHASRCTAWSATSTARRCRSRRATPSTRWRWIDRLRRRRRAVRAGPRRQPGHRHAARRRRRARGPQLRHQAVERHPLRAGQRRVAGAAAARRARRTPTAGSSGGCARSAARSTRCWRTTSSPRPPRRSTTSRGTSSATGTWSWPSRSSRDEATAEGTRAVLGHVLDALLRLLHPVIAVRHRGAVEALTGGESVVVAPVAGRGRRAGRHRRGAAGSSTCRSWSPRSAGSAPSSGCPTAAGSPPGWSGSTRPALGGHRAAIASLVRLDAPGDELRRRRPRSRSALAGGAVHVELDTSGRDRRRRRAGPAGPRPRRRAEGARRRRTRSWATRSSSTRRPPTIVDGIRAPAAPRPRPTSSGSPPRLAAVAVVTPDDPGRTTAPEGEGRGRPTRRGRACCAHVLDADPRRRLARRRARAVVGGRLRGVPRRRGRAGPALARDGDRAVARADRGAGRACSATRTAATPSCT